MDPIRERIIVKYLFESKEELNRLCDVYEALIADESVIGISDAPADPDSASLTVESSLGFWGIDAHSNERPPRVTVSASTHIFADEDAVVDAPSFSEFVDFAIAIQEVLDPVFTYGVELYDMTEPPFAGESLSATTLNFVPWFTVFTPPLVDNIGRETLVSTPAARVEELDNGGVLLVTHNPLAMEVDAEILDHVGLPSAFEYDRDRGVI